MANRIRRTYFIITNGLVCQLRFKKYRIVKQIWDYKYGVEDEKELI